MTKQRGDKQLTAEQQERVANNHNLIYAYIQRHNLNFEDYYDLLAIALCKAAQIYDENRTLRFSTLAWRCMSNAHGADVHRMYRPKHIPPEKMMSYDTPTKISEGTQDVTLLDVIASKYCSSSMDVTGPEVQEFLDGLSPRHRRVVDMLMDGFTQKEIAAVCNCSHQRVSQTKKQAADLWTTYSAKVARAS